MKLIYLGADHAGFELKEQLKNWLKQKKICFNDLGNKVLDVNDDYPDYAEKVAKAVVKNKSFGILVCGSAQGMCIAANKIRGVRAVVPFSLKETILSREHTGANIICLSGWFFTLTLAKKMVNAFLTTSFSKKKRHFRRLQKIKRLEQ